jgi:predicted heme/steroid binding protein
MTIKEEYSKTKSFFGGGENDGVEYSSNGNIYSISDTIGETYRDGTRVSKTDYLQNLKSDSTSIDEILNEDINTNTNFDNNITLEEILKYDYKTNNLTVAAAKDIKDLSKSFSTNFEGLSKALDNLITKEINKKQSEKSETAKKLEALQKLIASGGDIGVLSAEEKVLLQNEISKYTKKDDKYNTKELQDLYNTIQKTNEYKTTQTEDTLGKYYEDRS